jgi:hypothetical protein
LCFVDLKSEEKKKVFLPLQIVVVAWFWIRTRPEEVLLQLRDGSFLLLPPVLWFVVKRLVDSWYSSRVRRDESKLRDLFDQQVKSLKSIEEDPVFRKKMDLLQKYGKNVPSYSAPQTPLSTPQSQVKQRVVAPPSQPKLPQPQLRPQQQQQQQQPPQTPVQSSASTPAPAVPIIAQTPKTPKVYVVECGLLSFPVCNLCNRYTQPVERPSGPPRPPVLAPPSGGGFFQSLMDLVVGDGPSLAEIIVCSNCQANNGLVAKGAVPDIWVCKVCTTENRNQSAKGKVD